MTLLFTVGGGDVEDSSPNFLEYADISRIEGLGEENSYQETGESVRGSQVLALAQERGR